MSKETLNFSIGEIHLKMNIPTLEQCYPGIEPFEYNVLIAPAQANNTVGKLGLIHLPETAKDQIEMANQVGRIVAVSPLAFNFDKWEKVNPPQINDVVLFAKFAGGLFLGADGREYRLVKDKDIVGVIPELNLERLEQVKSLNEISKDKAA